MPTSEARLLANRANAAKSTGPTTPEGKERSRGNALKHGLTGEGIVLPDEDAAEVERRMASFEAELKATGEVGRALARRAAICSVRMDRCVLQEAAALADRVRTAEAEFQAPEGLDPAEAARLRAEAGRRAMFDPSKEATMARKYEAAAERGFFRALKELRQLDREAKAAEPPTPAESYRKELGSFLTMEQIDADLDAIEARLDARDRDLARSVPSRRPSAPSAPYPPMPGGRVEVPFTIGRGR